MQSGSAKSVWRELARHRHRPLQSVCHGWRRWHNLLYASIIAGDEMPEDVKKAWSLQRGGSAGMACLLLWHHQQRQVRLLNLVDADPEPRHVEAGGVEKLGASPLKKRKKVILEPRLKNSFLCFAELQRARQGWEVACGGEEALPVLLEDPRGHTAALAENTIGAQCSGQTSRSVGGTGHIVDGRGREGHRACALVLVRHLRRHGSGARQNWCGLAAVDTLGADLSVEAGAVRQRLCCLTSL